MICLKILKCHTAVSTSFFTFNGSLNCHDMRRTPTCDACGLRCCKKIGAPLLLEVFSYRKNLYTSIGACDPAEREYSSLHNKVVGASAMFSFSNRDDTRVRQVQKKLARSKAITGKNSATDDNKKMIKRCRPSTIDQG